MGVFAPFRQEHGGGEMRQDEVSEGGCRICLCIYFVEIPVI